MDADLYLVLGVFMAILAVPSLLSAYSEGRAPRVGAIFALAAGVLEMTMPDSPRSPTQRYRRVR